MRAHFSRDDLALWCAAHKPRNGPVQNSPPSTTAFTWSHTVANLSHPSCAHIGCLARYPLASLRHAVLLYLWSGALLNARSFLLGACWPRLYPVVRFGMDGMGAWYWFAVKLSYLWISCNMQSVEHRLNKIFQSVKDFVKCNSYDNQCFNKWLNIL